MKKILLMITGLLIIGLGGCANVMERKLDDIRTNYPSAAAKLADKDNTLDLMIAGDGLFQIEKYKESDRAFESVNKKIPDSKSGILSEIVSATSNNMNNPYRPSAMDSLFISYYQIWDAFMRNDFDTVRVIINQAYNKQQSASREFATVIKKRQKSDLADKLRDDNAQWKAFSDITNPALTYLSGLYFLNVATDNSDWENARLYIKRASGMSSASAIKSDLGLAEARVRPNGVTWIFIESGFIPKLHETRIDWPVIVKGKTRVISIATANPIEISEPDRIDGGELLADGDSMFMTEFKEYEINRVLRSVASATAKMMLQSVADDKLGAFGSLAASVYSIATTSADVRNWATLPKKIYVLRFQKSDLIKLTQGGRVIREIKVDKNKNNLIYLRIPNGVPKIVNF